MAENHWLPFAPILVIDLRSVFHLQSRHSAFLLYRCAFFPISNFQFPISVFSLSSPLWAGSSSPSRQSVPCARGTTSSASTSTDETYAMLPVHETAVPSRPPQRCPASAPSHASTS